jgi:hypothetical protein
MAAASSIQKTIIVIIIASADTITKTIEILSFRNNMAVTIIARMNNGSKKKAMAFRVSLMSV